MEILIKQLIKQYVNIVNDEMLAVLSLKSEMRLLPRLALCGCYLSAYCSLCVPE